MGYEDGLTWPFRLDKLLISVIVFILLLIFTIFPVFIFLFSSENIWQFLLSILLLLISVSDYAIIQALVTSKPPASISYLVGRRYHPVYYFCIVSIVAVLYFSIGLIGAGYTGVSMTNMDWFYATFEIFGLIFMSVTFVLPGSIYEEGIKIAAPAENPVADVAAINALGMEPRQWYDTRKSVSTQALLRIDTLQVFNLPGSTSWKLNLIFFYFGYALEVAEIIAYFALLPKDAKVDTWWKIYILVASISSFLSLVFFSGQFLRKGPSEAQLLSQMISLFMIVMAVIVLSLGRGNLITNFGDRT